MRIVLMAGKQKEKKMKLNAQPPKPRSDKITINLSVDSELKKAIQIWCIENDDKPSLLTERLWQDFLNGGGGRSVKDGTPRVIKPK